MSIGTLLSAGPESHTSSPGWEWWGLAQADRWGRAGRDQYCASLTCGSGHWRASYLRWQNQPSISSLGTLWAEAMTAPKRCACTRPGTTALAGHVCHKSATLLRAKGVFRTGLPPDPLSFAGKLGAVRGF